MCFLLTFMLQTTAQVDDIINSCDPEDHLFVDGDFNCTVKDILERHHGEPLVFSHDLVDV